MKYLAHFRLSFVLASGLVVGGCLGTGERHASNPGRRPSMPTMAAGAEASQWPLFTDAELTASALRAAQGGDVAGATRTLTNVSDPIRRRQLMEKVTRTLVETDPRMATRLAIEWANTTQHLVLVSSPARAMAKADGEQALRWSFELPDSFAARAARRSVVEELVATDARGTIVRIEALPAGATRDELLIHAAGAWTRRDPDAAIAWLRTLPETELKRKLTSSVGFAVAHSKPERALEVAEMLPEGRDRWLLLSAIGQTWVAVDSKAAVAWAAKLPAGEQRDAAFAGIDTGYGMPVRRRIAGAPGSRGVRTRGGAAMVALEKEASSPDFAAWLATQGKGMSRDEAILEYVRQRGALQPAAVGPLIESLPMGATREQATAIYVEGLLIGSPGEAARWVRSLPRSERSDELIEKTAKQWLLTNPDAAADWIQQSTLPEHRKEQLLRDARR
jgi:hypothetical protein